MMRRYNVSFIHFVLLLIIGIHVGHINIVKSQEGQVSDEESTEPTPSPSLPPTAEFPKSVTFMMSIFMDTQLESATNSEHSHLTLNNIFTRTLCLCVLSLPANQCNHPIIKYSPNPTTSPTLEPTFDPSNDPTNDPTSDPTFNPSMPTLEPTVDPTIDPTLDPTINPTRQTDAPTINPTNIPTNDPTNIPTNDPTHDPTLIPTEVTTNPSVSPTQVTANPTTAPTINPSFAPSFNPSFAPSDIPTNDPSVDPTLEPTFIPTSDPTLEPTFIPTDIPTNNPTNEPSFNPTNEPTNEPTTTTTGPQRRRLLSMTPSVSPSVSPSLHSIYDLDLEFTVNMQSRKEEHMFYRQIKSVYFFDTFKQCLLDALNSNYVLNNYANTSIIAYKQQIESMQISPLDDIDILTPTYAPTSYPTYNYQQGQDYGYWMIGVGVCVIVAVIAYWLYTRYTMHQYYKLEQKSAPANVELQTLFDHEEFAE